MNLLLFALKFKENIIYCKKCELLWLYQDCLIFHLFKHGHEKFWNFGYISEILMKSLICSCILCQEYENLQESAESMVWLDWQIRRRRRTYG